MPKVVVAGAPRRACVSGGHGKSARPRVRERRWAGAAGLTSKQMLGIAQPRLGSCQYTAKSVIDFLFVVAVGFSDVIALLTGSFDKPDWFPVRVEN